MSVLAALRPYEIPGFADPFSSISHLLGAAVFAALSVPLVRKGLRARHEDGWRPGVGHVAGTFGADAVEQHRAIRLARREDARGGQLEIASRWFLVEHPRLR